MSKHGKKYKTARAKVETGRKYTMADACALVPSTSVAKFDETVDIAIRLGVDPKHADQMVRGAVVLPHGTGKKTRIVVIAKGDKAKEALEAGADHVGAEDIVDRIQKENWTDFDTLVATPDMMGLVGRLGRVLGPKGLMPNPKVGTVTADVKRAVAELKAGRVEYRVEKAGVVHSRIGKVSFGASKLSENALALIEDIQRRKPQTSKGTYLRSISLSTSMGPGLTVDTGAFVAATATS
ncbi:MAG: 50S ribosomal protein L1 [Deltaproteobacteria bacterium]|mgnify:CR=1 FL=1|nr:50S ribosomal protein L1 [Deltaproteobacteria bacterium]